MIIDGVANAWAKTCEKRPILTIISTMMLMIILFVVAISTKIGLVILIIVISAITLYVPISIIKEMFLNKKGGNIDNETLD